VLPGRHLCGYQILAVLRPEGEGFRHRVGTTFWSKENLESGAALVGASITGDLWDDIGQVIDVYAGMLNVLTAGILSRLLNWVGGSWLVDTTSEAYRAGQIAGVVVMFDCLEEFRHFHRQGCGELLNVHQTQITSTAFHIARIHAMNARLVSEVFLCQRLVAHDGTSLRCRTVRGYQVWQLRCGVAVVNWFMETSTSIVNLCSARIARHLWLCGRCGFPFSKTD